MEAQPNRPHRSPCPSAELAAFVAAALAPGEPVLVGASGGGDSTALLILLTPVARAQGRRLVAAVVDHGLRDGSAKDAARAAALVAGQGAEVRSVRLGGLKPTQAAARAARYAALADIARDVGTGTVFLGHTADDQAETVLLRRAAGSGPRGLAGMAPLIPCPIWPEGRDLTLARPLLGWRRMTLRDVLRAEGVDWIEDPANELVRFARVRARADLSRSGETEALVAQAAMHDANAADADRAAFAFVRTHGAVRDDEATLGAVTLDDDCLRALAVIAAAVGGAERPPSPESARRLAIQLLKGQGGTLAGARFRPGRSVHVSRDPGGVRGRRGGGKAPADLPLPAGQTAVWDRRLALTATEDCVAIAPAGAGLRPSILRGGVVSALETSFVRAQWLVAARIERLLWRGKSLSGA